MATVMTGGGRSPVPLASIVPETSTETTTVEVPEIDAAIVAARRRVNYGDGQSVTRAGARQFVKACRIGSVAKLADSAAFLHQGTNPAASHAGKVAWSAILQA